MSKEMIEYKENFISKVKRFFKNLFGRKQKEKETEKLNSKKENLASRNGSYFKESVVVRQGDEELKIASLQRDYKQGRILEEDMTDEEHRELIRLYKKQNQELKEKIDAKKKAIKKKIEDLKAS